MRTSRRTARATGTAPSSLRSVVRIDIGSGRCLLPGLAFLWLAGATSAASAQPMKPKPVGAAPQPRGGAAPAPNPTTISGAIISVSNGDDSDDDDEVGEHDGTIVRIDGDLLYFDVGTERGVRVGQTVQVLRTITAKHPVTGRRLVDHFPLGTLVVEGAGSVLSVGKAQRRIAPLVKIGDVVNVTPPPSTARAAAAPAAPVAPAAQSVPAVADRGRPSPASGAPTSSATTAAGASPASAAVPVAVAPPPPVVQVVKAFEATLGRPLPERIPILEEFLSSHRDTPYRSALEGELTHLRAMQRTIEQAVQQLARAREQRTQTVTPTRSYADAPVTTVLYPSSIDAGQPLEITIYVGNPAALRSAMLYVRRDGEPTYQLVPFKEDATGYYRLLVPSRFTAAGVLEMFIGLLDSEGRLSLQAGRAEQPTPIRIEAPIGAPPSPGPNHSAVSGFFEFVDFNRFRGNDYYFNAEADFMYRIGSVLYSVRTGFGTLSGYGESVNNLDVLNLAPRPVGINYGYLEGELRFHRLVGLAVRGLAGQSKAGPGGGAELKLRIGSEMGTNLIVGGAIISDFGGLAQLKLEWNVIRNWPMSVTVVATNQPVQTDLGVRLFYQVGWRFRHWFAPTLRVGYDVRNINHGGLSIGLGLVMGW